MAKFCPILNRKVVYLDCLECDDKQCKNPKTTQKEEKGEQNKCHSTTETPQQTFSK